MLSHHRLAAAVFAALIVAAPAAAIDIAPSLLQIGIDLNRQPDAPLIEFDNEDWASFIGGNAPDYQLSGLGTAADGLGLTAAFRMPVSVELGDERVFTQVWERR
jgi:hypothetical protein